MPDIHGLAIRSFRSPSDWERWLQENHAGSAGVWLKLAKRGSLEATRGSLEATVSYGEALELALCFGWIDGQKAALDERFWLQRFTPRRPSSRWSRINRERAELLLEQGRMRPAGLAAVQSAKLDGSWEKAYVGQASAKVPLDLEQALAANRIAAEFFAQLDRANRYSIIYRIEEAKLAGTRAKRIATYVAMLERGEKIHN